MMDINKKIHPLILILFILILFGAGCAKPAPEEQAPQAEAPAPGQPAAAVEPKPLPKPDLQVRLSSTCASDRSLSYVVNVNNNNKGPAGPFKVRLVSMKRDLTASPAEGTTMVWAAEGIDANGQLRYSGTIPNEVLKAEDIVSLRVKVDADEEVDERSENNNQEERESDCERFRPNLSARVNSACNTDGSVAYVVTVDNFGSDQAGAFTTKAVAVSHDGSTPDAEGASAEWKTDGLSPKGSLKYTGLFPAEMVKEHKIDAIRVKADIGEVILESNENDNQEEKKFTCGNN